MGIFLGIDSYIKRFKISTESFGIDKALYKYSKNVAPEQQMQIYFAASEISRAKFCMSSNYNKCFNLC